MNTTTSKIAEDLGEEVALAELLTDLPYLRVLATALEHVNTNADTFEAGAVTARRNAVQNAANDAIWDFFVCSSDEAEKRARRLRALAALLYDELDEAVSGEAAVLDFVDDESKATCKAAIWEIATDIDA